MSDYKSCIQTLDKLVGVFSTQSTQNECRSNHDIGIKKAKLLENMRSHKQHLQSTLSSIHSSHGSYQSLLENPVSDQLAAEFVELERAKSKLEREIEDLQQALKAQQERENAVDETGDRVDQIRHQKKQKIKMKIPALKHKLKLYQRISVIEWKDVDRDSAIISGLIGIQKEKKQGFRAFSFDKNAMSQFDLVQEMWRLSDEEIVDGIRDLEEMLGAA